MQRNENLAQAEQEKQNPENILTTLYQDLDGMEGNVKIFVLDQNNGKIPYQYPLKDQSKDQSINFIAELCSNFVSRSESKAKREALEFFIEEIELYTNDKIIYIYRIDEKTILCIVGDIQFLKTGTAKRKIEGSSQKQGIKQKLIEALY